MFFFLVLLVNQNQNNSSQDNSVDNPLMHWNSSIEHDLNSTLAYRILPEMLQGKTEKRNFSGRNTEFIVVNDQLCYNNKGSSLISTVKGGEETNPSGS